MIAVSCAYFGCKPFVREAVESILAQTERDLVLVVVNDGDPDHPWDELADIDDRRLVRFDLPVNRGCYFAHEVVLRATQARWFAIQDADDTSSPERFAKLHAAIERENTPGAASMIGGRYNGKSHHRAYREIGLGFRHRRCHAGLWDADALRATGGYFGGYRVGWDSMMVNAMALLGELRVGRRSRREPIAWVPEILYTVRERAESLTAAPATCRGSIERTRLSVIYRRKWRTMLAARDARNLAAIVRRELVADITPEDDDELELQADRLRQVLP